VALNPCTCVCDSCRGVMFLYDRQCVYTCIQSFNNPKIIPVNILNWFDTCIIWGKQMMLLFVSYTHSYMKLKNGMTVMRYRLFDDVILVPISANVVELAMDGGGGCCAVFVVTHTLWWRETVDGWFELEVDDVNNVEECVCCCFVCIVVWSLATACMSCLCVCVCACVCVCVCVFMCMFLCMFVCVYVCVWFKCVCDIHVWFIYICVCVCGHRPVVYCWFSHHAYLLYIVYRKRNCPNHCQRDEERWQCVVCVLLPMYICVQVHVHIYIYIRICISIYLYRYIDIYLYI